MSSVHPLQTYSSSRTAAYADCLSRVCAALREVCRHGGLRSEIAWKQLGYGIESNSRCRERIRICRLGKEESTLSTVVKRYRKKDRAARKPWSLWGTAGGQRARGGNLWFTCPLHPVTVGIKIGRSTSRRSACSTPSFSGNVKSQMEREGGVSEARTTNWARGGQALEVLAALRSGDSFLHGLCFISGLRWEQYSESTACHLGKFSLDSKILKLKIFCVCHHDETTKKRSKNSLQLTERQQKRKRGKFRGKRGEKSGVSQSYKWTAAA